MKFLGFEIRKVQKDVPAPIYTHNAVGALEYNPYMTVAELLANSTVNACTGIIADSIASLPLNVYKKTDKGRIRYDKSDLAQIFRRKINFYQKPFTFKKQIALHLLLKGNAFIYVQRLNNKVIGLYALNPERVTIKKYTDKNEYYYTYSDGLHIYKYTSDEVLHIPAIVWDGVRGLSPIEYASKAAKLGNDLDLFTNNSFDGNIHSKMLVTVPFKEKEFSKDDAEKVSLRIQSSYGGIQNAGKPIIFTSGMTAQAVDFSTNNASQLVENRTFSVKEIAKIFRVPLSMLGETDAKYNNNEQQARNFLQNTLRPWLTLIEEYFSDLIPIYERDNVYLSFDTDKMTRADPTLRTDMHVKCLTNGIETLNDYMRMEDLPLIDSAIGDIHFMPANLAPLTPEYIDAYMANQKATAKENKDEGKTESENQK